MQRILPGMNDAHAPVDFWTALLRGWHGRCPRCSKGRLFSAYLKMNGHCDVCDLPLEPYRADDAPAYFTIFVVGHIVVPLVLLVERWGTEPPLWVHAILWLPLSVALALILLPRIKGAVIALLWTQKMAAPKAVTGGFDPSA